MDWICFSSVVFVATWLRKAWNTSVPSAAATTTNAAVRKASPSFRFRFEWPIDSARFLKKIVEPWTTPCPRDCARALDSMSFRDFGPPGAVLEAVASTSPGRPGRFSVMAAPSFEVERNDSEGRHRDGLRGTGTAAPSRLARRATQERGHDPQDGGEEDDDGRDDQSDADAADPSARLVPGRSGDRRRRGRRRGARRRHA